MTDELDLHRFKRGYDKSVNIAKLCRDGKGSSVPFSDVLEAYSFFLSDLICVGEIAKLEEALVLEIQRRGQP